MTRIISFFMAFLLLGCSTKMDSDQEQFNRACNNIINSTKDSITRKLHLEYRGEGISAPGRVISSSTVFFRSYNQTTPDEARNLALCVFDIFYNEINSNKNIQAYLYEHPFREERIEVIISFYKNEYELIESPYISNIIIQDGLIYYKQYERDILNEKIINVESLNEARVLVQK